MEKFNILEGESLKVAVVHDWLFVRRGGERVLENILALYPQADLYYLFGQPEKALKLKSKHKFFPSFLNSIPFIAKFYKHFLPLFPVAIESFDLSSYDLVISSSSCVAKGVICSPTAVHVSYIHSPMRYAWDQEHKYFPTKVKLWRIFELTRRLLLAKLRVWDVTSSVRIDTLLANSYFVARRCQLYYGKSADVIYPPVDLSRFADLQKVKSSDKKILLFGAWVPYKGMKDALDLLVSQGISVIAAGQGADLVAAQGQYANKGNVEFVVHPNDDDVTKLYAKAHALLFPGLEDFGIVCVEAMAAGLKVVAPDVGGTAETVIDGHTGYHFKLGDRDSMLAAVKKALTWDPKPSDAVALKQHAQRFSQEVFQANLKAAVDKSLGQKKALS